VSQSPLKVSSMLAMAALSVVAAGQAHGQARLVSVSSKSAMASAPSDTPSTRAWHDTMPDHHLISARVRDGVLTIDGMVAKVKLNYDIQQNGYMYFFIPGVGTAVVSMAPMEEAVKVADAFDGGTLSFPVDGHSVQLSSESNLLPGRKSKAKADVYVRLDRSTVAISRYPRMGYGDTTAAPYAWPVSNPELASKEKYVVTPPPTPKNMLPEMASR